MSGGRTSSSNSTSGYQVGVLNVTNQDFGSSQMLETSSNWTWRSPPPFTNSSNIQPGHPSGLVPGLIAAGIFIMFLLCLYAILWKCMVSPPNKQKRKRLSRNLHHHKPLVV